MKYISIIFLLVLAFPQEQLPSSYDLRESGILTPVKHQMNLGACGVFAAVAVAEALIKEETGKTVDLSEQHVINMSDDWVPSGISSVDAMKFITEHGIVKESELPYEDKKTSKKPGHVYDYKLKEYHSVVTAKMELADKVKTIKKAIMEYGPVATNMTFYKDLDAYTEGIYEWDGKATEEGGHWIVIVGWYEHFEIKNGGCWICRNSWGPNWGENGYFRIPYGECGVDDFWFVYGVY
jgi:C1A family cysteine protease